MSETSAKARVRHWLRGEQALGLGAVKRPVMREATVGEISVKPALVGPIKKIAKEVSVVAMVQNAAPAAQAQVSPIIAQDLTTPEKVAVLGEMDVKEVSICTRCRLCESRTKTVFGEGDPDAKIFFIGEGPGETEDQTGRPFVGRAGELLNKMIAGMGLKREEVFIANIVKCRPPGNRVPAPDEVAACTPYLERQLAIIQPRVIVTLGLPAAKYMLATSNTMGRLRGVWTSWRGIKLMPTYHPAYLLRAYTPENRAAVWNDLKLVMSEIGLKQKTK